MMKTTNDYCVADEVMKKLEEITENCRTILELSNVLYSSYPPTDEDKQRTSPLDFGMYTIDKLDDINFILKTSIFKLAHYAGNTRFDVAVKK